MSEALDELARYFRVRPVDVHTCPEEWFIWVHEILDQDERVALMRAAGIDPDDVPGGAKLHPEFYDALPDEWAARVADWLEDINWDGCFAFEEPHDAPSWAHMEPRGEPLADGAPILHFTDFPERIAEQGFKYGVPDPDRIALTRLNDVFGGCTRVRHEEPGYNFGYLADGSVDFDARVSAMDAMLERDPDTPLPYGRHATLVFAPALCVYHAGDRERQAVFHGPDAAIENIVPLVRRDGQWHAPDGSRDVSLNGLATRLAGEFRPASAPVP